MTLTTSQWLNSRADFPEDRVSYGVLVAMDISPAQAIYKKYNPKPPTAAMDFGKAVDVMLIGGGLKSGLIKAHGNPLESSRTKAFAAGKEKWMSEHPGGVYLSDEIYDRVDDCATTVLSTDLYKTYCQATTPEYGRPGVTVEIVPSGETQVVANVPDILIRNPTSHMPEVLIDIKCVASPDPYHFRQQVNQMRWDVQAAAYVRMVEQIEGNRVPFYWFVIQNTAPWNVAMYQIGSDWLKGAEKDYLKWVCEWQLWKEHDLTGETIQINDQPEMLDTPPWRI